MRAFLAGVALLCAVPVTAAPPTLTAVSVSATAPWANDPAVEAAALLYDVHGAEVLSRFWNQWASTRTVCETTLMACTLRCLDALALPALERTALGAALAARIAAPRVEAWAQMARLVRVDATATGLASWYHACGAWHDTVEAAVDAIDASGCAVAGQPAAVPTMLDHALLPAIEGEETRSSATPPMLVGFVDPHAAGFGDALRALSEVPRATASVVLRYRPSAVAADGGVPLVGIGATVRVKSSEYRVADDRAPADDDGTEDADDDADAVAADAVDRPSWLLRRKATEPITMLRGDKGALSEARLAELPTQAAIATLRARRSLATLRDIGTQPRALPHLCRPALDTHHFTPRPPLTCLDSCHAHCLFTPTISRPVHHQPAWTPAMLAACSL